MFVYGCQVVAYGNKYTPSIKCPVLSENFISIRKNRICWDSRVYFRFASQDYIGFVEIQERVEIRFLGTAFETVAI